MFSVQELFEKYGESLGLELITGHEGLNRRIEVPEAHRPGLGLAGYLKGHAFKRILIFGRVEIQYLRSLDPKIRIERLEEILGCEKTPAVMIARGYRPLRELQKLCRTHHIPLFRSDMRTMNLLSRLTLLLHAESAPSITCHGTLVEVFGVGVLIQGDSSVGKSETALGLIERGHRLISDDVVRVKKREGTYLEGFGAELTRHHMEIRGIGIINVAHLYGAVCVRDHKSIDIVVKLEAWDDQSFYDRIGIEEKHTEILGVKIPFHVLPVKPGRDVVLLLETIALNHRLKGMGYNSAIEFKTKLLELTAGRARLKKMKAMSMEEIGG